ncbi:hypothetical protein CRUP_035862 [Coryphaenoides rupestris]|nr:hypothetical protein CRUP_035862 [Coryphaenoides rupestris]
MNRSRSSRLDKTLDLDERRVIRSALRELRRQEIEEMEAALASKRFRPTRLRLQEDKENQQGIDNLRTLRGALINDWHHCTHTSRRLRGASEYEERKMIRAAIHRLRGEEQEMKQGSERGKAGVHILEPGNQEPQCTMGTARCPPPVHTSPGSVSGALGHARGSRHRPAGQQLGPGSQWDPRRRERQITPKTRGGDGGSDRRHPRIRRLAYLGAASPLGSPGPTLLPVVCCFSCGLVSCGSAQMSHAWLR